MKPWSGPIPILLFAVGLAAKAQAAPSPLLTMDGLAPLKFGMSVKQIERAIGPIDVNYDAGGDSCGEARAKRPWIPGVFLMIVDGRLARIDIDSPAGRTEAGVGVGSTTAAVRSAYRGRLKTQPRPYDDDDQDLIVSDRKRGRKIIFETYKGRIESVRSGLKGPVDYIEGCA